MPRTSLRSMLLLVLMTASQVSSYTTSHQTPYWKPSAQKRSTYDLGLGKNAPVNAGVSSTDTSTPKSVYEIAQYWPIHTEELKYPSPAFILKKQRQRPTVKYVRQAQDYLPIMDRTIMKEKQQEFDLNTPWVELLIHEQLVRAQA